MKVPDIFTDKDNFWELNPSFVFILNDFYNSDKSKNKEKSSKIMWAIYFRTHPKSDFYNLANKDAIIKTRWLKDESFKWEDYEEVINTFKEISLTQAEKSLVEWDIMLKKRDDFMHSQDFTLDYYETLDSGKVVIRKGTADQLDKMLANTNKLYAEYFKIQKELSDEEITRGRGNKPLSMSDSNEI